MSSGDRAISLFPTPGATACDGVVQLGHPARPLHRRSAQHLTTRRHAPVLQPGRPVYNRPIPPAPAATSRPSPPPTASTSRRSTSSRCRWSAMAASSTVTQDIGDTITLPRRARSTTGASRRTRRRLCRCSSAPTPATAICSTPSSIDARTVQSVRNPLRPQPDGTPTARPNYAFIGRRVVEAGPRRYDQRSTPITSRRRSTARSRSPSHDWHWDVNGVWGRNNAKQDVHGNVNAANLAAALGPVAACTAPCVPFNIFGGAGIDHPGDARLSSPSPSATAAQRIWDVSRQPDRRPVRPARRARWPSPSASSIATTEGRFDPDADRRRRPVARTFPALPTSGAINVNEAYAELRLPLLARHAVLPPPRARPARRAIPIIPTSGSTTTFRAGINWEPVEELLFRGSWAEGFRAPTHRRIVRHALALRPGGRRPLLGPHRGHAGQRPRQLHRPRRPGQRLLRPAQRPAAGDHRRQHATSSRRPARAGTSAACGSPAS